MLHTRSVYGLFDILGELGGIQLILQSAAMIFICPLSEFTFIIKAISKLFMVRTKTIVFKDKNSKKSIKTW